MERKNFRNRFDQQYLSSKAYVDEASQNLHVKKTLRRKLQSFQHSIAILDIGAGTGSGLIQILKDLPDLNILYFPLDIDEKHLEFCRQLPKTLSLENKLQVHLVNHDIDTFLNNQEQKEKNKFDLILAHSFFDLIYLPDLIPKLHEQLKPQGLLYTALNYDGRSTFLPIIDVGLDCLVEDIYNRSMGERYSSTNSYPASMTGTILMDCLRKSSFHLLAAGSSGWNIDCSTPQTTEMLKNILSFHRDQLEQSDAIAARSRELWLKTRHYQLETKQLAFHNHQWDLLAQKSIDDNSGIPA